MEEFCRIVSDRSNPDQFGNCWEALFGLITEKKKITYDIRMLTTKPDPGEEIWQKKFNNVCPDTSQVQEPDKANRQIAGFGKMKKLVSTDRVSKLFLRKSDGQQKGIETKSPEETSPTIAPQNVVEILETTRDAKGDSMARLKALKFYAKFKHTLIDYILNHAIVEDIPTNRLRKSIEGYLITEIKVNDQFMTQNTEKIGTFVEFFSRLSKDHNVGKETLSQVLLHAKDVIISFDDSESNFIKNPSGIGRFCVGVLLPKKASQRTLHYLAMVPKYFSIMGDSPELPIGIALGEDLEKRGENFVEHFLALHDVRAETPGTTKSFLVSVFNWLTKPDVVGVGQGVSAQGVRRVRNFELLGTMALRMTHFLESHNTEHGLQPMHEPNNLQDLLEAILKKLECGTEVPDFFLENEESSKSFVQCLKKQQWNVEIGSEICKHIIVNFLVSDDNVPGINCLAKIIARASTDDNKPNPEKLAKNLIDSKSILAALGDSKQRYLFNTIQANSAKFGDFCFNVLKFPKPKDRIQQFLVRLVEDTEIMESELPWVVFTANEDERFKVFFVQYLGLFGFVGNTHGFDKAIAYLLDVVRSFNHNPTERDYESLAIAPQYVAEILSTIGDNAEPFQNVEPLLRRETLAHLIKAALIPEPKHYSKVNIPAYYSSGKRGADLAKNIATECEKGVGVRETFCRLYMIHVLQLGADIVTAHGNILANIFAKLFTTGETPHELAQLLLDAERILNAAKTPAVHQIDFAQLGDDIETIVVFCANVLHPAEPNKRIENFIKHVKHVNVIQHSKFLVQIYSAKERHDLFIAFFEHLLQFKKVKQNEHNLQEAKQFILAIVNSFRESPTDEEYRLFAERALNMAVILQHSPSYLYCTPLHHQVILADFIKAVILPYPSPKSIPEHFSSINGLKFHTQKWKNRHVYEFCNEFMIQVVYLIPTSRFLGLSQLGQIIANHLLRLPNVSEFTKQDDETLIKLSQILLDSKSILGIKGNPTQPLIQFSQIKENTLAIAQFCAGGLVPDRANVRAVYFMNCFKDGSGIGGFKDDSGELLLEMYTKGQNDRFTAFFKAYLSICGITSKTRHYDDVIIILLAESKAISNGHTPDLFMHLAENIRDMAKLLAQLNQHIELAQVSLKSSMVKSLNSMDLLPQNKNNLYVLAQIFANVIHQSNDLRRFENLLLHIHISDVVKYNLLRAVVERNESARYKFFFQYFLLLHEKTVVPPFYQSAVDCFSGIPKPIGNSIEDRKYALVAGRAINIAHIYSKRLDIRAPQDQLHRLEKVALFIKMVILTPLDQQRTEASEGLDSLNFVHIARKDHPKSQIAYAESVYRGFMQHILHIENISGKTQVHGIYQVAELFAHLQITAGDDKNIEEVAIMLLNSGESLSLRSLHQRDDRPQWKHIVFGEDITSNPGFSSFFEIVIYADDAYERFVPNWQKRSSTARIASFSRFIQVCKHRRNIPIEILIGKNKEVRCEAFLPLIKDAIQAKNSRADASKELISLIDGMYDKYAKQFLKNVVNPDKNVV